MNDVAPKPHKMSSIFYIHQMTLKKNIVRSVDVCVENLGQRVMYLYVFF